MPPLRSVGPVRVPIKAAVSETQILGVEQPSGWWCVAQASTTPPPTGGGAAGGRTVVISDVHIGTNVPTCWYQQSVHEPYLATLLDYVIAHASGVSNPVTKLVILGDLFDFWTYPPEQKPPAILDIATANPNILGQGAKLGQAIDALGGNAVYFHGNHDIGVTQADLDSMKLGKHKLPLVDDMVVDPTGLLLTHGHLFTMFNAPDDRYPGEVPVGHFVTRAIAHLLAGTLAGGTAAGLSNQGSPYGFDLESFVPALLAQTAGPSVTGVLLDYMAARCGLAESAPIVLADGSSTTIAEAKKKYDGLWDHWVARYGGGEVGETFAAKAVQADYNGDYMAWFSQKAAWDHAAKGAVTGHTHIPRQGIQGSDCLYLNCGFECPASPDVADGAAAFNFGVIDADGTPSLWSIVASAGTYCVGPTAKTTPDTLVYAPFSDYSCYVTIANNVSEDLTFASDGADEGYYVTGPPAKIPAGSTARFWLQDFAGIQGAEGSVTYEPAGTGNQLAFSYGCPFGFFQNYASGGSSFLANSGSAPLPTQPAGTVPPYGHPLYVDFRVDALTTGVQPWTPRSLLALAVDAAGFDYDPGQDIIYSKMYPLQRDFGYAYGYDAAALAMSAIIDCEPIFFDYNGKTWMIELWKGQYGLETGCEIGVYNRTIGQTSFVYGILDDTVGKRPGDPNPSHNQYFDCASDSDLLLMSSTLYRQGKKVFSRGPERHWWLTGFKWGLLSDPSDLTMDVSIECLDAVMTAAFAGALTGMGYAPTTSGNTVSFTFGTPKTPQPRNGNPQIVSVVETANQQIVAAYDSLGLTSNDPNTVGDQAAAVIGQRFALYSEEFFVSVVASAAQVAGVLLSDAVQALSQGFNVALAAASQFLTNAGYTFESWINGIGDFLSEAFDFSCMVEISNRGSPYELTWDSHQIGHGHWGVEPPQSIPAGGAGRFWLQDDKPSPSGSDGWVQYAYTDTTGVRRLVKFSFDDPTGFSSNDASSSPALFGFYTKSGNVNAPWSGLNSVTTGGHPFYVTFVWGNASLPSDA